MQTLRGELLRTSQALKALALESHHDHPVVTLGKLSLIVGKLQEALIAATARLIERVGRSVP